MAVKMVDKYKHRLKKKKRIRKKISGTSEKPRLVLFRSLKHIYAQLVDDTSQKTLLTVSSLSKEISAEIAKAKTKTEIAKIVGLSIARKAKDMKFESITFDRSGYIFHGRIKAVADGAREGGLIF